MTEILHCSLLQQGTGCMHVWVSHISSWAEKCNHNFERPISFQTKSKYSPFCGFWFENSLKRFTYSYHTTEETYHLSTRSSYLRPALCVLHDTNKAMISTPFVFLNLCFSTWTHSYAVYVDYLLFCLQSSIHAKKETKSS